MAPFSDRYGRDMLLVELLCFDEECDFEDPASEWSTEKIQRRLSQSAAGEHLRHLAAEDVFQLPEDRRPTSYDLARALANDHAAENQTSRWNAYESVAKDGGWPRVRWGEWVLAKVVIVLWALCLAHWGLISFRGAAWLLSSPATPRRSGIVATALSLAARGFLGLGVFLVGAVGLSILAFAEDQPRLISFGGVGFRIPPGGINLNPIHNTYERWQVCLRAILAMLALVVMVQVCFL